MTDKSDIEALAFEGLDYFEKAGDEGDKAYVSAIRELLARRLQPARVPEGWVLVPREPTPKMMQIGANRWTEATEEAQTIEGERQAARAGWAAMLAAAPQPTQRGGEGVEAVKQSLTGGGKNE